ncbi:SgcJ/EcaC family oxidoreductase [Deminuibacter soli]|uniref:SgcJ/EcaC family oxidoreductase n=2 Tax=Deminuibacter soli TaxID=2291815 RepID=A0A3E1NH78_9BACT|nr:SgcJ/EcaC family oxidoreductase [Deminuibacter soli]
MLLVLVFTCSGYLHAQTGAAYTEAQHAIAASNAKYHQAFAKNDSSIFINSYAEDACILAPGMQLVCGRGAIAHFFTDGYKMGIRGGKLVTTKLYGDGVDYITEEGWGQIVDKDGKLIDEAKYIVVWKKTSEGWKMYRDIFNGNPVTK